MKLTCALILKLFGKVVHKSVKQNTICNTYFYIDNNKTLVVLTSIKVPSHQLQQGFGIKSWIERNLDYFLFIK